MYVYIAVVFRNYYNSDISKVMVTYTGPNKKLPIGKIINFLYIKLENNLVICL